MKRPFLLFKRGRYWYHRLNGVANNYSTGGAKQNHTLTPTHLMTNHLGDME